MVAVHFTSISGERKTVDAQAGNSLMEAAIWNGVDGIEALCGGGCSCGTCHVYVAEEWIGRLDAPNGLEAELIELAPEPRATSRLACQIRIEEELDGLEVTTPAAQRTP